MGIKEATFKHFFGDGSDGNLSMGMGSEYVCVRDMQFKTVELTHGSDLNGNGHVIRIAQPVIICGDPVIIIKPVGRIRVHKSGICEITPAPGWSMILPVGAGGDYLTREDARSEPEPLS